MVITPNILSGAQNAQLFATQQTSRAIGVAQTRLATGNRVNSPIDNPQNFFAAFSLSSQASSLSRVLDGIGQGISSINIAESAREGLSNIIGQARDQTQDALQSLRSNQEDLGARILADNPVIFYRLDETSGTTATNLGTAGGTLNGTYQGAVSLDSGALTLSLDNASVRFDGASGRIAIPNNALVNTDPAGYAERTVELTFSADNLNGRQVLFEEGGTGNSAAIYLDDDRIYFVARDAGDFGPFNISAEVEADKTYQAAFVLDSNSGTFTGYLNGEEVGTGAVNRQLSRHGGAVAIGRNAGGTFFHDGANGGNGEYFDGRISDFALYNDVLSQDDLRVRYDITQLEQAEIFQQQVTDILSQITPLTEDASFRGVNLLQNDNLVTDFNVNGSSNLLTEGQDLSFSGLGFAAPDFTNFSNIDKTLFDIDDAEIKIRDFGNALANDLGIINIKQDYISNTINTLNAGSEDLTRADINEEGANLLSLQTQQQIQTQTLSLSASQGNIADLLLRNPFDT